MAGTSTPLFLVQLLVFTSLLAVAEHALAGRQIPLSAANFENTDRKQPEWFIEPDNTGSVLIPGIGRIMVPPQFRHQHSAFPYYGSWDGSYGGGSYGGSSGSSPGRTGRNYIPGGDDTLIPNPGVEVPSP